MRSGTRRIGPLRVAVWTFRIAVSLIAFFTAADQTIHDNYVGAVVLFVAAAFFFPDVERWADAHK